MDFANLRCSDDLKNFKFEVSGSVTGADGIGSNTEKFISKSGRVVIDPVDWERLVFARNMTKTPPPKDFTKLNGESQIYFPRSIF